MEDIIKNPESRKQVWLVYLPFLKQLFVCSNEGFNDGLNHLLNCVYILIAHQDEESWYNDPKLTGRCHLLSLVN